MPFTYALVVTCVSKTKEKRQGANWKKINSQHRCKGIDINTHKPKGKKNMNKTY